MTHGGNRRRQVAPALTMEEVDKLRSLRAQGYSFKDLHAMFPVCRETMSQAINGRGTYAGTNHTADELRKLQRKVRELTVQRDLAKGRVAELLEYTRKYQRELVELRRELRKGPHE